MSVNLTFIRDNQLTGYLSPMFSYSNSLLLLLNNRVYLSAPVEPARNHSSEVTGSSATAYTFGSSGSTSMRPDGDREEYSLENLKPKYLDSPTPWPAGVYKFGTPDTPSFPSSPAAQSQYGRA